MSTLAHHIDDYMAIRRSLGFRLNSEHRLLGDFAAFMDAAGASTVTIALALRWATLPTGVGDAFELL
jgi:integrase/recombinase XerD